MTSKALILAGAFAFIATAGLAQPRAPENNGAVVPNAYNSFDLRPDEQFRQCFNGQVLTGVNRAGDDTVYAQSRTGRVYRMSLAAGCPALAAAEKLSVRARGGDVVCAGDRAEFVVKTSTGIKRCDIAAVSALGRKDVLALASTPRR